MTVNGQIATTIVHTDDYTGYVSPYLIINKENLLNIISKERDICASTRHKAGGINYTPATEDWQKAIGAFNFCMSADVSATEKKGVITYTMKLTIHAQDKYNFNPGMTDIATRTPDDANGIFELTGLGKQFMQNGTSTHIIKWSVKGETTP